MGRRRKAAQERLPAEWVPRQVKGPILMHGGHRLYPWAWGMEVATLVGIAGSFLPEAAAVALKVVVVVENWPLRVRAGTQVEFNAGLALNAFTNA